MSDKLKHISEFLPTLRELFDDSVFFTVVDTNSVVQGFSLPPGVRPTLFVGDVMEDPSGASQEVMRTGVARRNLLPKEAYGAAYEGILAPITEGGKVIGCIICTHSVESNERNAEIARRFRADINDMETNIGNIDGDVSEITSLLSKVADIIGKVEDDVKSAKTAVAGINKNADTSSILAINASIEAARAGAAGKGFAIVASEMNKLSGASKKSSDSINKTLDLIVEHLNFIITSIRQTDSLAADNKEKISMIKQTLSDTLALSEQLEKNVRN